MALPDSNGSPKKQRLSGEERREQILVSARRVFVRSGLAGARTRDVAAEAGINEGLLYRHFSSKDELFEAAVARPLEEAVAALVEVSGEPPEDFDDDGLVMRERTRQFIYDLLAAMEEIAPLLGIVLFGDIDRASAYYRDRVAPSLAKVEEIVTAHRPAWAHRDFDVELVVHLVFGMTWFLTVADQFNDRQRSRQETAEKITALVIDGLITPTD
jgi:TetR/AcrR family transcriptional regulator